MGLRRIRPGRLVLVLVVLGLAAGTVDAYRQALTGRSGDPEQRRLIAELLHAGATRLYTDYWTCDRIAFESRERIICSVPDTSLRPGQDRYPPYKARVTADPGAAYLFPAHSPQARRLAAVRIGRRAGCWLPRKAMADGYVLDQPCPLAYIRQRYIVTS